MAFYKVTKKQEGGSGEIKNLEYTLIAGGQWETFTNPDPDNGMLLYEVADSSNDEIVFAVKKKINELAIYSYYSTLGTFGNGLNLNVARTSNSETIYISVNDVFSGYTVKVYTYTESSGGLPSLVTEKKQIVVQDGIPNPAIESLTFTEDVKYAFISFGIDDNVNNQGFLSFNGTPIFYIDKMAYGIVPVPSNKVLTGTFPYSDGGAEFLYYGALGMNRLPSDFAIRTSSYTGSSLSITLDKVYDHVVIFHAFDHGSSNSIIVSVNSETLNYTVLPYKWNRYTYYNINEIETDSTTLNFTFTLGPNNSRLIVFAYND